MVCDIEGGVAGSLHIQGCAIVVDGRKALRETCIAINEKATHDAVASARETDEHAGKQENHCNKPHRESSAWLLVGRRLFFVSMFEASFLVKKMKSNL